MVLHKTRALITFCGVCSYFLQSDWCHEIPKQRQTGCARFFRPVHFFVLVPACKEGLGTRLPGTVYAYTRTAVCNVLAMSVNRAPCTYAFKGGTGLPS